MGAPCFTSLVLIAIFRLTVSDDRGDGPASERKRERNMKLKPTIFAAIFLLLVSSTVFAGIIFVPVSGIWVEPESAEVIFNRQGSSGKVQVETLNLNGAFFEAPGGTGGEGAILPFLQDLILEIDLESGIVEGEGRAHLRLMPSSGDLDFKGEVSGEATCVAYQGNPCDQLLVDFEIIGVMTDPTDPARVGLLSIRWLGSLIIDGDSAYWASLSATAEFGGDRELIDQILDTMDDAETTGV